ncbi:hypothetical protein MTR67_029003 [Solanum verrucosum]|uniref:Uncharacterized protein n=1 Tax=Solanum verrucosum TaxID=315347 RepID=A0AAF0U0R6_SOLVR|nr:hypothetical protein MTR67_029003 [Solanum verrucosum]
MSFKLRPTIPTPPDSFAKPPSTVLHRKHPTQPETHQNINLKGPLLLFHFSGWLQAEITLFPLSIFYLHQTSTEFPFRSNFPSPVISRSDSQVSIVYLLRSFTACSNYWG